MQSSGEETMLTSSKEGRPWRRLPARDVAGVTGQDGCGQVECSEVNSKMTGARALGRRSGRCQGSASRAGGPDPEPGRQVDGHRFNGRWPQGTSNLVSDYSEERSGAETRQPSRSRAHGSVDLRQQGAAGQEETGTCVRA